MLRILIPYSVARKGPEGCGFASLASSAWKLTLGSRYRREEEKIEISEGNKYLLGAGVRVRDELNQLSA